jgi:SAM-dependent methyltransferase
VAKARSGKREWWQQFFRGSWIDFQLGMDRPESVRNTVDFLEAVLDLKRGTRVLDAPCGEGRISRELARRGHLVTGVDITPALLRVARRKAKSEGLRIDWIQGDMREAPARGRLDLALCWWGSFGYFSEAENLRHAKAMATALRPGGVMVVQTHSPETLFPRFQERHWDEGEGLLILSENRYDEDSGRIETDWTFIGEDSRRRAHSSIRLYTVRELRGLFGEAGFTKFQTFGNLEGEPFGLDSRRLVFVARKG